MSFKLWSETNEKAKNELKPNFSFRSWNSLSQDDKYLIWKNLEFYFFRRIKHLNNFTFEESIEYVFFGMEREIKKSLIYRSISLLNQKFKVRSYARNFLKNCNFVSACEDFYQIFFNESENVVLEIISIYCKEMINKTIDINLTKEKNETVEEYQQRLDKARWQLFDEFSKKINEIFLDFGLNIYLTRIGFVSRQEEKIIKEVYNPVINFLSHPKWLEVNKILSDSFEEYRKNTSQGYSVSITHAIAAIEAFLQIILYGKLCKGVFSKLIKIAQKKNLIPNDFFTQKIFDNLESIFARQRKENGIAHPKEDYANEKNARLILNLAMIFMQHCIQK